MTHVTTACDSSFYVPRVNDEDDVIARNLTEFLRANLKPGQNADVAINPSLRQILVFVDDELALTCSFDDLMLGPEATSKN